MTQQTTPQQGKHQHGEDCRHLLASLSDYVDGDLDDSLCLALEAHLAECDNCRVVVDTLALTVKLYRETPLDSPLPDTVRSRLLTSLNLAEYVTHRE